MEKNIKNETVTGGISHRYIRDIEGDLRIRAPSNLNIPSTKRGMAKEVKTMRSLNPKP